MGVVSALSRLVEVGTPPPCFTSSPGLCWHERRHPVLRGRAGPMRCVCGGGSCALWWVLCRLWRLSHPLTPRQDVRRAPPRGTGGLVVGRLAHGGPCGVGWHLPTFHQEVRVPPWCCARFGAPWRDLPFGRGLASWWAHSYRPVHDGTRRWADVIVPRPWCGERAMMAPSP